MSYPIRSGIWFKDEDDFNKIAADLKDLLDYTEKDKLFVHWETYGDGETVEIFEYIAKKYPKMTCMGYCQYCGMGGGTHLSITVNQGDVNVKKELIVDDISEYEDEEANESNTETEGNKSDWNSKEFDKDQKDRINNFLENIESAVYDYSYAKDIIADLDSNFEHSKTAREAKIWADIISRLKIVEENMKSILAYNDIVNPVQKYDVTVTVDARSEEEAKAIAYQKMGTRREKIRAPF